jgi:hypothetical protein
MEIFMLEHFYVKPSTIDRIRDSWLGSQIDNYVGWMEANGYSSRTVYRRLPRLFSFAEFAQRMGCTDVASAFAVVEEFVSEWLVQHGSEAKASTSLRKHAIDVGNDTRQMLRLASGSRVRHNRHRRRQAAHFRSVSHHSGQKASQRLSACFSPLDSGGTSGTRRRRQCHPSLAGTRQPGDHQPLCRNHLENEASCRGGLSPSNRNFGIVPPNARMARRSGTPEMA